MLENTFIILFLAALFFGGAVAFIAYAILEIVRQQNDGGDGM